MSTGDRLRREEQNLVVSDLDREKASASIIHTPDLERYNRTEQRWMV
ncbi:hypothetical protein [Chamaesiphon sp.]